ncbi:Testican-1 [Manis pentadactyla]|nr:Testican-1 [Manis pentadactyla]
MDVAKVHRQMRVLVLEKLQDPSSSWLWCIRQLFKNIPEDSSCLLGIEMELVQDDYFRNWNPSKPFDQGTIKAETQRDNITYQVLKFTLLRMHFSSVAFDVLVMVNLTQRNQGK